MDAALGTALPEFPVLVSRDLIEPHCQAILRAVIPHQFLCAIRVWLRRRSTRNGTNFNDSVTRDGKV